MIEHEIKFCNGKEKLQHKLTKRLRCRRYDISDLGGGNLPCFLLHYHTIPYHTIPYHTIPYHTIPYHTIPYHTIPYHAMPCHAMPCHAMPCHAMPCHAMPCRATPRHATPRHAMPCHAMPYHTITNALIIHQFKTNKIIQLKHGKSSPGLECLACLHGDY